MDLPFLLSLQSDVILVMMTSLAGNFHSEAYDLVPHEQSL